MKEPSFLTVEDILFIHDKEIQKAGDDPGIRQEQDIQACADAPKASFNGEYLNGYEIEESYDLELADLVLGFLSKDISKEDLAKYLKDKTIER